MKKKPEKYRPSATTLLRMLDGHRYSIERALDARYNVLDKKEDELEDKLRELEKKILSKSPEHRKLSAELKKVRKLRTRSYDEKKAPWNRLRESIRLFGPTPKNIADTAKVMKLINAIE